MDYTMWITSKAIFAFDSLKQVTNYFVHFYINFFWYKKKIFSNSLDGYHFYSPFLIEETAKLMSFLQSPLGFVTA